MFLIHSSCLTRKPLRSTMLWPAKNRECQAKPHLTCSHLQVLWEPAFCDWGSSLPPSGPLAPAHPLGGFWTFLRLSLRHLPAGFLSSTVWASKFSFCLALLCFAFSVLIIFLPGALPWPGLEFLSSLSFGKCFTGLISKASVVLVPACGLLFGWFWFLFFQSLSQWEFRNSSSSPWVFSPVVTDQ